MNLAFSNDDLFIRRLDELIEANLADEKFGVKELIEKSGLNERLIRRKMKGISKKTISQYITGKRLEHALKILQQNEITASEVAFQSGFSSPAYFNSCFHQYFGFSPGEAKKRGFSNQHSEILAGDNIISLSNSNNDVRIIKKSFLKKLRIPVILSAIVVMLLFLVWIFRFTPASGDKSIIVLPFKDYSADAKNQDFADGITEDILNSLYKMSDLQVRSRTTSDHFRGTALTSKEIAREVKARNVLEGSVRQEGNKIRISVQLIDAYDDRHIWSENYDRELENILGIQGEIALQVADKLNAVLSSNEIGRVEAIPTRNFQAYDLYRRGRFLINKASGNQRADLDREGLMNSVKYFEMATEADSSFALGYAGLAEAWFTLSAWGWYKPYPEGILKAKKNAEKALTIDPDCAEAHFVKASWLIWPERKFEEGRREFETTLRLSPNFPGAHQNFAQLLMITGPISEAREHMDRTIELDPYYWVAWNLNAWIYYFEEKYDKAIEACQMARDLNGNYWETDWLFFLNYARMGKGDKAAEELQKLFGRYPGTEPYLAEIKNAAQKSGATGLYNWLIDLNLNHPINTEGLNGHPYFLGWWYALIGDKEKSLYWLEKNMSEKNKWVIYFDLIATNPDFDILRNDPRFLSIIDRQGLTPYNKRKAK